MSCMRNNHRTIFTVKKPPPLQKGRNERTCDNCMILSSLTCAPEAHSSSESLLLLISFSLVVSNRSRPKNASCVGGKIKCITNTENYNTIEHLEIKHIDVSQQIGQRQMFTKLWHWLPHCSGDLSGGHSALHFLRSAWNAEFGPLYDKKANGSADVGPHSLLISSKDRGDLSD